MGQGTDRNCAWTRIGCAGALLLGALIANPGAADAARIGGVEFPPSVPQQTAEGRTALDLCGAGLLRYRRLFKAYAVAWYRADCQAPYDEEGPQRLELSYFWAIPADRFGRAAEAHLQATLPPGVYTEVETRMAALHRAYRDVRPGDRYALTFIPGQGTELTLNGGTLTVVDGADFARVYFGLWVGEAPLDDGVRDALRGRVAGTAGGR